MGCRYLRAYMEGVLVPRQKLYIFDGTEQRLLMERMQGSVFIFLQHLKCVFVRKHNMELVATFEVTCRHTVRAGTQRGGHGQSQIKPTSS